MKAFSTVALFVIVVAGCASARKTQLTDAAIEYKAVTRGRHLNVNYKNDTLSWYSGRGMATGGNQRILTAEEKESLFRLLDKVQLEDLNKLKSPTNARMYDGAMIADIKIITKDSTYESSSFDHGKPPAEIAEFVSQFLKFTGDETYYGN